MNKFDPIGSLQMNNKKLKKIINQIANQNGLTPQEVENEMKLAIRTAMKSTDPKAQALWKEIAPDGNEPPLELFLTFLIRKYQENNPKFPFK